MLSSLKESIKAILSEYEITDIDTDQFLSIIEQSPDIIVIGRENRTNPQEKDTKYWMTKEIERKLTEYVKKGGKLFAWHSGLASYPEDGEYCSMLRGYFKYHPEKNKRVRYYSVEVEFLKGKKFDFEILDEHYFVHCDTQNTNVFLYSESEDGKSIAGWMHNFGDGKILALTPAHRKEGLESPEMRALLKEILKGLLYT